MEPDDVASGNALEQYQATMRDLGAAHGSAFAEVYTRLTAAGMYSDHAAQITSMYAAMTTADYLNSKNRPGGE